MMGKLMTPCYRIFQFSGKLAPPGTTAVYPLEIREVVREQFSDERSDQHDEEYDHSREVKQWGKIKFNKTYWCGMMCLM